MAKIDVFLPNLAGGGAERSILATAAALTENDSVRLLLAAAKGNYLDQVPPQLPIVDLGAPKVLAAIPALRKQIRSHRPDAILSALDNANAAMLIAAKLAGFKGRKVISIRNNPSQEYAQLTGRADQLILKLCRLTYRSAHSITCVSEGVRQDAIQFFRLAPDRVRTIYNPVLDENFDRGVRQPCYQDWLAGDRDFPVAVAAGRFTPQKSFDTLLDAVALTPSLHLVMLGEGPLEADLRAQAARLGIADRVRFEGFVTNPFPFFRSADVFVLSSRFEGLPGVLVQAMGSGTRLVSTDCPSGPREILNDGEWGTLVPIGDASALAEGILKALGQPRPMFPAAVTDRFRPDRVVKSYREVLVPQGPV